MKSQSLLEIVQGDTAGIWRVHHPISAPGVKPVVLADLSAGYTCTIKAINADGSVAVAERAVTVRSDDDFYFLAALFPTETATIAPGDITVGLQLTNLSLVPPLRRELHRTVRVAASINANV